MYIHALYTCVYIYIYVYTCIHVYMYTCICVYMYICIYYTYCVYIYIYIYHISLYIFLSLYIYIERESALGERSASSQKRLRNGRFSKVRSGNTIKYCVLYCIVYYAIKWTRSLSHWRGATRRTKRELDLGKWAQPLGGLELRRAFGCEDKISNGSGI